MLGEPCRRLRGGLAGRLQRGGCAQPAFGHAQDNGEQVDRRDVGTDPPAALRHGHRVDPELESMAFGFGRLGPLERALVK